MDRRSISSSVALALALVAARSAHAQIAPGCTHRSSTSSGGVQANAVAREPAISADGRLVVFWSRASNLVKNDALGFDDVFVQDLPTGIVTRLSVDPLTGAEGNGHSGDFGGLALSGDTHYVAFATNANNLAPFDGNGVQDVIVFDLAGAFVALASVDTFGVQGNQASTQPSLSGDGRLVAFQSLATNLVAGDTNAVADVFVHDLVTGRTSRVSLDSAGNQANGFCGAPSISADGRWVAFESTATNLVAGDTNGTTDIFLHDRASRVTVRVSVGAAGAQANGGSTACSVSGDGKLIAFESLATNLVLGDTNGFPDVFVRDLALGATSRASVGVAGAQANGDSSGPVLTPDGRFLGFASLASNLVAVDTNGWPDVFVRDLASGTNALWSVSSALVQGDRTSRAASLSSDGCKVAFESLAANLVSGDGNGVQDVFVHACTVPPPATYCTGKVSSQGCYTPMSYDGTPSATAGSGFLLYGYNLVNQKAGILFYSVTGSQASPFFGSTMCVAPPFRRTPLLDSGGNPPPDDCSGFLSMDFNAYIASGADPALVDCQRVWAQFWMRDPPQPSGTLLTEAVAFTIGH